jgi:hypothetical protein
MMLVSCFDVTALERADSGQDRVQSLLAKVDSGRGVGKPSLIGLCKVCPLLNRDPKIHNEMAVCKSLMAPVLAIDRSITRGLRAGAEDEDRRV